MSVQQKEHLFKRFDKDLDELRGSLDAVHKEILQLFELLEKATTQTAEQAALTYEEARAIDRTINAVEVKLDQQVSHIIARYNPLGEELRFLISTMKIAAALERVGDVAKNCVKRMKKLENPLDSTIQPSLHGALEHIRTLMGKGLHLIREYDEAEFLSCFTLESEVDQFYKQIIQHVQHRMQQQLDFVPDATRILFLGKNLERMADLSLDIAKTCYYVHHGEKYQK